MGRYLIGEVLSSGDHGAVLRARDVWLDRAVLVRFPSGARFYDVSQGDGWAFPTYELLPLREVAIKTPYFAECLDVNYVCMQSDPQEVDGLIDACETDVFSGLVSCANRLWYVVVEEVDGASLEEINPVREFEMKPLIGQLFGALDVLHDEGIVHLDLRRSSIVITPDGEIRVVDFGVVTSVGEAAISSLENPNYYTGDIPESAGIPFEPDRRHDIYAVGKILDEVTAKEGRSEAFDAMVEWCCQDELSKRPSRLSDVWEKYSSGAFPDVRSAGLLQTISSSEFQGAFQDINHEYQSNPEAAKDQWFEWRKEYPAFDEVSRILLEFLEKYGMRSVATARMEGMKLAFEAVIRIEKSRSNGRSWLSGITVAQYQEAFSAINSRYESDPEGAVQRLKQNTASYPCLMQVFVEMVDLLGMLGPHSPATARAEGMKLAIEALVDLDGRR